MNPTYYLSPGVHTCCTGDLCVFLDLKRDQYISVNKGSLREVARRINGLTIPRLPSMSTPDSLKPQSARLLDGLREAHLITTTAPNHPSTSQTDVPLARDDLTSIRASAAASYEISATLQLTKALCRAHLQLSRLPISRIVENIKRQKFHCNTTHAVDMPRLLALARNFARYRFFYPKNYLCLFDSLALLLYLARYNLYPMWVFGVREAPFFAHCWVQAGTVVLTDYRDKVTPFTPIMAI